MTDNGTMRSPTSRAHPPRAATTPRLAIEPIGATFSFKNQAYAALKNVIVSMDVYRNRQDIRLDERQLAQDFGVSRTPVREAMAQLEREGFVRAVPRRGIYIVRKTKREVIEMITAWAALESMAARLITVNASDDEIATLRRMFEIYAERFADADGRIRATFEIVWLSGWAPHPSQQQPLAPGSAKTRLADALRTQEIPAGEKAGR